MTKTDLMLVGLQALVLTMTGETLRGTAERLKNSGEGLSNAEAVAYLEAASQTINDLSLLAKDLYDEVDKK